MSSISIYQANVNFYNTTEEKITKYFLTYDEIMKYLNKTYLDTNMFIEIAPYTTTEGSTEHQEAISLAEATNP